MSQGIPSDVPGQTSVINGSGKAGSALGQWRGVNDLSGFFPSPGVQWESGSVPELFWGSTTS